MNRNLRLFWPGLFLLVAGWQFLAPIFTPTHWIGLPLVMAGSILIGLSLPGPDLPVPRAGLAFYAVAAVALAALAPFPFRLGGVLLLGSAAFLTFFPPASKGREFGSGLLLAGIIFVCQSFCLPVLLSIGSVFHRITFLAPVMCDLFRFLGYSAYSEAGTVFVQTDRGVQEFSVSAEYFGWFFVFNAILGVVLWQTLGRFQHRWRNSLGFLAGVTFYALGRYLLLAVLYLDLHLFSIFWNPWIACVSFLPLFLWLWVFCWKIERVPDAPAPGAVGPRARNQIFAAAGAAISLGLLVGAWGWEDPGRPKPGRMLIDQTHSDWEKMDRAYDTEWFGQESGYNYYCLAEFLGHYYHVQKSDGPITAALLADCDILVLKTPTRAFTTDEIDAIEAFVARGGGLLLIGDHTNVFGTSTYLNSIGSRFGLHYNIDATYDLPTQGLTLYNRPGLLPHPIVQRLPPFLFGTSCTLDVPWGCAIPINGYSLRTAGHDYSTPSFFSNKTDGPDVGFGLFPQLGAMKFHRGRVIAFTDSTVFSNFWMFVPGKPELMLGCTEWLDRQNRLSAVTYALYGIGLVLGAIVLRRCRGQWAGLFPALLAGGCLGFFAATSLTAALNRLAYPWPRPHTPYRTICFDGEHSRFKLPTETLMIDPAIQYLTFYTCVQRMGYVPQVSPRLEDALKQGDGVVLINPSGRIPEQTRTQIKSYVDRGGVLFVFNSPTNNASTANAILDPFGMTLAPDAAPQRTIVNAAGEIIPSDEDAGHVVGGDGVLFDTNRNALLAIKRTGKGAIIAAASAGLVSDASLGTTSTVPTAQQKRLYRVVFDALRQVEYNSTQADKNVRGSGVARAQGE